jgi:hypothetical protein
VPSFVPVAGVAISIALLTQVESTTDARVGFLVAVGAALWIVNWLILRSSGLRGAGAAG